MAELNLKQIIDRLNAEFTGETRKLVFWYDDKAEFAEDMETVELQNAKIYHLQPDNQFYTKYFLERVDKTTNYLIYAPFPKPDVRDNHLEDTMLYSRRFFADRASLLSVDLGIEEKYKPVIEKHIKFFANKERTQRFYDLEIENFNEENILVGLLSAVCKARTCSFEEVVRIVLTDGELVDNAFLQEFEKYDLLSAFWQLCEQHFGYTDTKPSLERLLVTLFVTYTGRYVQAELPAAWKSFVSYKSGNIIAFLDSLMNSVLYRDKYDALSAHVAKGLNVLSAFAGMRVDDLVECDTFLAVDQVLVKWLIGRLVSEDIGAIVNGFTIPELCEKRAKMHFGRKTGKTYQMLSSAYSMVKEADYHAADGLHVYDNPVGVLTNNPPFPSQMFALNNYAGVSRKQPESTFAGVLQLDAYSRGMGGMGIPGDLSSQSRFVKVAFTKLNSISGEEEDESVSQFFHILGSVDQQRGCCEVTEGKYEITIYTSCCNTAKGIYYYTTYDNHQITAVDMHAENLDSDQLICYPLLSKGEVRWQNK